MKKNREKWFLMILPIMLLLGVCFGCTKDEDDGYDPEKPTNPEKPKPPVKKEYRLLSLQTLSTYRSKGDTIEIYRDSEIELFKCSGIDIEKRKEDPFGIAYDKTNNKLIQAIAKSNGSSLYFDSLIVGERYYIHIKTLKNKYIDFNYESALSDTILTVEKSENRLDLKKIFTLRAEDNQYEPWNKSNRDLPKPDFGVAIWGDTKKYIEFNENHIKTGKDNYMYITYKYDHLLYTYQFDENNRFKKGIIDYSLQYDALSNRSTWPIRIFQSEVEKLIKEYGVPVFQSEDVFRYDVDNYSFVEDPDNAYFQSYRIMRGAKTIEYRFQNNQKKIVAELTYYSRSDKYKPWGFTINTYFSKQ